jgi:predicted aspartyl protease
MGQACFGRRAIIGGLGALAGQAAPDDAGPLYAIPTIPDRIGRVLAPVTINGAGPFRFLVDTGANRTCLTAGLAQRLGLPVTAGAALVQGVTGAETVGLVRIAAMTSDRLAWRDLTAPVISAGVLDRAEGVLAADSFRGMRLTIDFVRDRIALTPAHAARSPIGFSVARCRLIHGALLAAPARIGGVTVTAVIDTGAERSIANSALLAALAESGQGATVLLDTHVMGVVGPNLPAQLVAMPAMAIGDLRVRQLNAAHLDAPIFTVWGLHKTPALLLGMDVLGQTEQLMIDYAAKALWMRFPAAPATTGSRTGATDAVTLRRP